MKLLAALVAFSFQVAQGRRLQTDTVPAYSAEQCDSWLAAASTFDADASGGISTDEYFAILQSLELVTVATSYAELDFAAKMSFTTIACMCKSLGLGDTCCEGEDAEIPLSVLSTEGDPAVDAYKADLCNVLASVILDEGATLPPVATPAAVTFDIPGTVPAFTAAEITANVGSNDVLAQVIKGFGLLSNEVLTTRTIMRRNVRGLRASERKLQLQPVEASDVTDIPCPAGLLYADEGSPCVNFKLTVIPEEEWTAETTLAYTEDMTTKIDAGELYDVVKAEYPETLIYGLGNPGKGVFWDGTTSPGEPEEVVPATNTTAEPVPAPVVVEPAPEEPKGLSTVAIIFIVLAVILTPIAILVGREKYRKMKEQERLERLRQYEASQASRSVKVAVVADVADDDEFYDPAENKKSTAGSSLAAMGAAGTAAAIFGNIPSSLEAIEQEVRILVEETKSPKSADELLKAYAGREADLLKNLRKMKALQDKNDAIRAEVADLVEATKSPRSADELLKAYAGREADLLKNLKKMKALQDKNNAIRAEVADLCQKVNSPKTPDELLESYKGREDELLKNLRRLSFKQQSAEEKKAMRTDIIALVEELEIPKSADELLTAYEGRENELLNNLTKMKAKKAEEAKTIAEIKVLVEELAVPKSADEMLASYKGREGVLLNNLKKMSSRKLSNEAIKAEVETLVKELNAPKSAEEMLASYEGREDVLLANLRKLKAKKDMAAKQSISKKATIAEITSLCEELKLPKTASQMLASYEGREEELLMNLQKMKSKKESSAAKNSSNEAIIAEVTSLCDELKPGKSAEELLAAYEGREQELLTHLKKLQSSKRNA